MSHTRPPSADYLTQWEQTLLNHWASDQFGYYAIQLGQGERLNALEHNRCTQRTLIHQATQSFVTPLAHAVTQQTIDDFSALPFESESIDLIVLPHTLDEHPQPQAVLREATRVLRGEGKMIILAYNPISLWGIQNRLRPPQPPLPTLAHPALGVTQLKDWLTLLNCDVLHGRYGCYAPRLTHTSWLNRLAWMEKAGDRWWGFAGAVYALLVVKRVYAPTWVGRVKTTPTRHRWVAQPALQSSPRLPNPKSQNQSKSHG